MQIQTEKERLQIRKIKAHRLKVTKDPIQNQVQAETIDPARVKANLLQVKAPLHHPGHLLLNLLHLQKPVHPGLREKQTHLRDEVTHLKVIHLLKKEVTRGEAVIVIKAPVTLHQVDLLQVSGVSHRHQKVAADNLE